jgi:tRNA dimethylallyltransferase
MAKIIEPPLVVIVGPTASGKSSIAVDLAVEHNGEIICADSRTIYTGMDIGTAKPSQYDQSRAPHWGLDIVMPGQPFSAADFKAYAVQTIAEIRARGHVPFLVGGTGLYVDGIIFDYEFGPPVDLEKRAEFERMSLDELHNYCIQNNIKLPENDQNKRYVIRAIEQKNISAKGLTTPVANTIIVGITTESSKLRSRITKRSEQLFAAGVVQEAQALGALYGWETQAMTGNIYRLAHAYLNNEISLAELKEKNETADRKLAKRQMTWLKRNEHIHWLPIGDVKKYIASRLASPPQS